MISRMTAEHFRTTAKLITRTACYNITVNENFDRYSNRIAPKTSFILSILKSNGCVYAVRLFEFEFEKCEKFSRINNRLVNVDIFTRKV